MSNFILKINVLAIVIVCACTAAFAAYAADANCQGVTKTLATCLTYLRKGGSVPSSCCDGIKSLKNSATTTAARRAACECLKTQAKSLNITETYASSLPDKCNVNIGYPISLKTDCNSIQ